MEPHPDFADVDLPREFGLQAYVLTPLSPDFVDEDLEAVLATGHLMDGIFGDWPAGLTRAENAIDLAWHEGDFIARRSFSWIIRDGQGGYIGCFYLFPAMGERGRAKAVFWVRDLPDRVAIAETLKSLLADWLAVSIPAGVDITWETRPVV